LGAFGEKLRKQREQQGISLDAVSDTTKISIRMLRALEEEHFDQLPGGVFNKGFVRAYARQVGLNEEEAIADYLAAVRETQLQAHSGSPDFGDRRNHDLPSNHLASSSAAPASDATHDRGHQLLGDDRRKRGRRSEDRRNQDRRNQGRPNQDRPNQDRPNEDRPNEDIRHQDLSSLPESATHSPAAAERFRQKYPAGSPDRPADHNDGSAQIPWGKLAVALLLVTFALALWNSRRHREPTVAPPALASNQSPALAPVTAPASRPNPSAPAAPRKIGKASSSGALSYGTLSPGTISPASTPSPATSASLTLPAPTEPSQAQSTAASDTTPPANLPSTFSLLIRAEETTWVSITADGKPVAQETLIAPAHTSVRATGEVIVKAGNAAGVSFQLNGKEIPAQGNEGEVKTYIFDAAGFRVLSQTQSPATVR